MANGAEILNGVGLTRVEQFNQLVRSVVTLSLVAGFLYAALVIKEVSQETYNNLVLIVVTWWFARDQAHAAAKETAMLKDGAKSDPTSVLVVQSPPEEKKP